MFRDLRQNNSKLLLQADFVECLPIFCSYILLQTAQKNYLSLTYATDLKCFCITVQFYIALQLEVQEVDVISTVLMQIYVKAHCTIFVKL